MHVFMYFLPTFSPHDIIAEKGLLAKTLFTWGLVSYSIFSTWLYIRKEVFWVFWRSFRNRSSLVPSSAQELADVVDVGVNGCFAGAVAVEGNQHPLSDRSLHFHVHDQ